MKWLYKQVNCNLCGSDKFQIVREGNLDKISGDDLRNIFTYKELSIPKRKNFCIRIVKCKKCCLVYMNPQFVGADTLYENSIDGFYVYTSPGRKSTFERDIKEINKLYPKKGSLLDLGCATGLFTEIAKNHGWDVEGVELSKWAAKKARSKNLKVHNKKLEEINFKDNSFDVITLFGFIEHIPNPMSMMKEVRRIIKKDGLIVVTIPKISFFGKYVLRKDFFILQHLTYFTPHTFKLLLNKAGLKAIKYKSYFRYMKLREVIRWFKESKNYRFLNTLFNNKLLGSIPFYNFADEYIFYVKNEC